MKNLKLTVVTHFCTCMLLVSATLAFADPDSLHREAIVIDTHSDYLFRSDLTNDGLADEVEGAQTTLGKLIQGGMDAQFFSVWAAPAYEKYGYARKTMEYIDRFYEQVEMHPEHLEVALTVDDIRRISAEGKIAALMGIEGGHMIEDRLALLRNYYRLGVRYMTLTWSNGTGWADSSGDIERWGGLTDFGREVVLEMNRIGMLVDISHVSDKSFWDVMEVTKAPVIASHSSVRAIRNHPRNMTDDMIKAVAKNNGVIQVNFYAYFLDEAFGEKVDEGWAAANGKVTEIASRHLDDPVAYDEEEWALAFEIEGSTPWPQLSVLIDHIDHIAQLVGPEHVGLGSDFDGSSSLPQDLEHQGKMPNITHALKARGYSDHDVKLILGENLLRVMADVENVTAQLSEDGRQQAR